MNGKHVIIVGAGPGDPDLITIKGMRAIMEADVILYDALVHPSLLSYATPGCVKHFVGKRKGKHCVSQEEINRHLLDYAARFNRVVRLKGGDPFVFGRGSEEARYLQQYGYTTEVIPGISSAIAGPSAAGIPVTARGVSESFWVITGTTSAHQLSNDVRLAAQSSATLIILMGRHRLSEIVATISEHRGPSEPVAIIQDATLPTQRQVMATLESIVTESASHQISTPAVIVVGKVVSCRIDQILSDQNTRLRIAV